MKKRLYIVAPLFLCAAGCGNLEWVSLAGCQRIMPTGVEQTWTPIIESDSPEPTRLISVTSSAPGIIEIGDSSLQNFQIRSLSPGDATITLEVYISYETEGYRRATFPVTVTDNEDDIPTFDNTCYSDQDEHIWGERPENREES